MNHNILSTNEKPKSIKNPLKFPSLGLFVSFKTIIEYIFLILKYALRGLKFLTIDPFMMLYNAISGRVDYAYKNTKSAIQKQEEKFELKKAKRKKKDTTKQKK